MKQYWMKVKYSEPVDCDNPMWILTQGVFRNREAVCKAYEYQAVAMGYEILEVKPHEQFEFNYNKEPATGCDYGIGG